MRLLPVPAVASSPSVSPLTRACRVTEWSSVASTTQERVAETAEPRSLGAAASANTGAFTVKSPIVWNRQVRR